MDDTIELTERDESAFYITVAILIGIVIVWVILILFTGAPIDIIGPMKSLENQLPLAVDDQ